MPAASSDLPESRPGKPVAFCLVLLRMGFTCAPPVAGRAVVSYSAFPPLPRGIPFPGSRGRYISVALALESPPPDVIRHPALRSPDFPHPPPSAWRDGRPRSFILLIFFHNNIPFYAVSDKPHFMLRAESCSEQNHTPGGIPADGTAFHGAGKYCGGFLFPYRKKLPDTRQDAPIRFKMKICTV